MNSRIDLYAAAFIASGKGPKNPKEVYAWAYREAKAMANMRCEVTGHTMRRVRDPMRSSGGYYSCAYCSHEEEE